MKNIILTLAIMLAASSASAQWSNDLYGNPDPVKKKKASSTVSSSKSSQSSQYSSSTANSYSQDSYQESNDNELVTSYEQALRRRYNAMRNATYEQPESYWTLMEQYQAMLEKKYNQNLYNIVVVGDEMWVEPQSITAQFDGSDPAAGVIQYNQEIRSGIKSNNSYSPNSQSNITIRINVIDPWDYWGSWGYSSWLWNRPYYYSPYYWGRPYYTPYHYPSYWGGGYYPPYWGGGYHHSHWGGGYYHNYYRNPKGTYYGNSRYNSSSNRPSYNSGSRPSYGSGGSSMGGGRPSRANGNNTVYGGTRPTRSGGGITTNRTDNNSYARPSNNNRPSSVGRPNSTTRPNVVRPQYERPSSTYERPKSTTTYQRPTSVSRPTSTPSVSRPASSGSNRSGSSSGGSMGGGRPTRR